MKCRVSTRIGNFTGDPANDICGDTAAVGIVFETTDVDEQPILQFLPVCAEHAPEETDEMVKTMNADEFAIVTLAYGQVGDLT